MPGLFQLGDDSFRYLLSWLDLDCICSLDTAIGNGNDRLLWLHSLHTMDSKAVDEHEHNHSSVRWLITSGVRATRIRRRGTNLERDPITDETFAGMGIVLTPRADNDESYPTCDVAI